jgi:hypothetical protein
MRGGRKPGQMRFPMGWIISLLKVPSSIGTRGREPRGEEAYVRRFDEAVAPVADLTRAGAVSATPAVGRNCRRSRRRMKSPFSSPLTAAAGGKAGVYVRVVLESHSSTDRRDSIPSPALKGVYLGVSLAAFPRKALIILLLKSGSSPSLPPRPCFRTSNNIL